MVVWRNEGEGRETEGDIKFEKSWIGEGLVLVVGERGLGHRHKAR